MKIQRGEGIKTSELCKKIALLHMSFTLDNLKEIHRSSGSQRVIPLYATKNLYLTPVLITAILRAKVVSV